MTCRLRCKAFLLAFCLLFCFLTACETEKADERFLDEHFSGESPPNDPEPYFSTDEDIPMSIMLGCENETDYSNITAVTEFSEYGRETEKIICTVTDYNVGKGFYIFLVPYIDVFQDGEWKRLNYRPQELYYENIWAYCCIEGNTTKPNSTNIVFVAEDLKDDFCAGDYRLVVFVGDRKTYAPFSVI